MVIRAKGASGAGCLLAEGRDTRSALGTMSVLVTMKKMSSRKITSVIEAMLKTSVTLVLRFRLIF